MAARNSPANRRTSHFVNCCNDLGKALYILTFRADSDHMERNSNQPTQGTEGGFGLVEAVIATALFLVLLVISIGPIMSSLRRLDTARLTTEAEKLGEAQLESIRALEFDDRTYSDRDSARISALTDRISLAWALRPTTETVRGAPPPGSLISMRISTSSPRLAVGMSGL